MQKIEERVREEPKEKKEEAKQDVKSKLDLFKEALATGLKNLEIKEEEGEKDNMSIVSVSEYSYSMSQAVFKNTRLPPLFGTRDFANKPLLNLYTEDDANDIYRQSISSHSQLPTSPDSGQAIKRENIPPEPEPVPDFTRSQIDPNFEMPPPPPPIDLVMGTIASLASYNPLPPPPPPRIEQVPTSSKYEVR